MVDKTILITEQKIPLLFRDNGDGTFSIYSSSNSILPSVYDYVVFTYSGTNVETATYKIGGANGTTVAVLTMTYDVSNNLLTIIRT